MLKYEVWACDHCGKEAKTPRGLPEGYLCVELYVHDANTNALVVEGGQSKRKLVCSKECASDICATLIRSARQ
jgi:hypothetical protein